MPELPEVQVMVNDLNAAAVTGHLIKKVAVFWPATISGLGVQAFCRALTQRSVVGIHRRGKYILYELDDTQIMAVHLRMSGRFMLVPPACPRPRHVQVEFVLDDGRRLWFHDTRKFGRFYLAPDAASICGHLGPEPMTPGFTQAVLARALARRRRQLKPLLLDQTFVAGLGNIYVDEALWAAVLHPQRNSNALSKLEIARLHRAVLTVLRQGIKHAGTSLGQGQNNFCSLGAVPGNHARFLKVYHRTGHPCPRCGQPIERIIVGQRSTHICPACQTI
jgi:formamidopyrimidine-DNA glycosylase